MVLLPNKRLRCFDSHRNTAWERNDLTLQVYAVLGDPRNIEQIVEQTCKMNGLPLDNSNKRLLLFVVHHQPRQDVSSGANGGYRIAKLVGERGQELVLAAIGVFERSLQIAQLGNVGVGAEPANDATVCITDRNCTRKEPTVLTIFAAQGEGV